MNHLYLESKYLSYMISRFGQVKKKSTYSYNIRCPYCGDSKKNTKKARGYTYLYKGHIVYHCHNCGVNSNIPNMLKEFDIGLYNDFIKERMLDSIVEKPKEDVVDYSSSQPKFVKFTSLKSLPKISQLHSDHYAKKYVQSRLIPPELHYQLFYCDKFKHWVNSVYPDKFEDEMIDDARLIIPFIDKNDRLFGFQGRAFKGSLRYITIMLDSNMPKLYGIDRVDLEQTVYVVEGPLDAMFIKNGIASAGGSITSTLGYLSSDKSKFVIIYDNEPRSRETVKKISQAIDYGYSVCIWPDHIKEKDINDMVLSGLGQDDVRYIIDSNTYSGLYAKVRLAEWKKV